MIMRCEAEIAVEVKYKMNKTGEAQFVPLDVNHPQRATGDNSK
jgi:hypothetical protein